jgi:predicted alpha/beta superfamily hydrolase
VPSRILARARDVLVYLPPGYAAAPGHRYPVLYLNDGQNLFDGATSFVPGHEWQVDETAERLIQSGELPPLIIVAVDNASERRLDEFGPVRDERRRAGGFAEFYGEMIVDELKPLIDATYRTRPGPQDTGIGGSSMGALVSLFLALTRPHVFGLVAAMSPAVWWGNRALLRMVRNLRRRPDLRIWLDIGTAEGQVVVDDVRLLRTALLERGWREGTDLAYHEEEGAEHTEAAWGARVGPMLQFLFGGERPAARHAPAAGPVE